jgi:hypothetical protein
MAVTRTWASRVPTSPDPANLFPTQAAGGTEIPGWGPGLLFHPTAKVLGSGAAVAEVVVILGAGGRVPNRQIRRAILSGPVAATGESEWASRWRRQWSHLSSVVPGVAAAVEVAIVQPWAPLRVVFGACRAAGPRGLHSVLVRSSAAVVMNSPPSAGRPLHAPSLS